VHLEEAPATPEQWEAWIWLWRKLLVKSPKCAMPDEEQNRTAATP
jgi:hypothetical protein